MSKTFKRFLLAGLVTVSATAAAIDVKPDAPKRYVVEEGDTLWSIAERYADDAWNWPEIWCQFLALRTWRSTHGAIDYFVYLV